MPHFHDLLHPLVEWAVILGALAVAISLVRAGQRRFPKFNRFTLIASEIDDSSTTVSRENNLIWLIIGAIFLAGAFAALEICHPYYFAQDDALVAEMPGMLEGCRSVWAGTWPDYDPCRLMGGPLAGTGLFSLTYPPTYLSYAIARHLLRNENGLLEVFAALHLAAGFVAMSLLCRRLGMRPSIGCCATLAFLLSGSVLIMGRSWHAFLPLVVWVPILIACVDRLRRGPIGWKWATVMGLAAGAIFHVGFPQLGVYAGLIVGFALLFLWMTGAIEWKRLMSAWPAGAIALGVAAPLLLAQFSAAHGLARPPAYGIGINRQWIAALLPYPLVKVGHPMGWGSTDTQYMGHFYYFGTVFALLFIAGSIFALARGSRKVWSQNIWLACAAVTLLLAMGNRGVLFYILAKLPLIGMVNNNPFRALPFFVLFAVLGGGVFAERAFSATRLSMKWQNGLAVLTLALLGYHVAMARSSFYTYGFKPYPPIDPSVALRIDSEPLARVTSWATERSIEPSFAQTLPLDLPMVWNRPAFSGYDPLLEWSPDFMAAQQLLASHPIDALRAYGVRWHLVSDRIHDPVFSPNPLVHEQERSVKFVAALSAVRPVLHNVEHVDEMRLRELKNVAPMAFPIERPTLSLPLSADGDGIKINLKKWKTGGDIVVNFLWHPQMSAIVDGKSAELSHDLWQRMVVQVPAGAGTLHIRYAAHWLRGMAIGSMLILIGLLGCWRARRGSPSQVDINAPN